jgi:hypothetical protein
LWGIEPQAIQQPIDFSVPQSKIILSVCLTLPEVDNDIRSEKTIVGICQANKLGRWTASPPKGYKFLREEKLRTIESRYKHLQYSFMDTLISASDYSDLKKRLDDEKRRSESELNIILTRGNKFEEYLSKAIEIIPNIAEWYRNSGIREKQILLGLIFPDKMIFDKNGGRTARANPMLALIFKCDRGFKGKEKGLNSKKTVQSHLGWKVELFSNYKALKINGMKDEEIELSKFILLESLRSRRGESKKKKLHKRT